MLPFVMVNLNILSLNCHGYNNGTESYLRRVSVNVDVILLRKRGYQTVLVVFWIILVLISLFFTALPWRINF